MPGVCQRGCKRKVVLNSPQFKWRLEDYASDLLGSSNVTKIYHKHRYSTPYPLYMSVKSSKSYNTSIMGVDNNSVFATKCFRIYIHDAIDNR